MPNRKPTVITPVHVTDLAVGTGGRSYWKQILPEATIDYTDPQTGKVHKLTFDKRSNRELALAYHEHALDQTPFVLADADNRHTMDPERFRAEAVDMRLAEELPPEVAAAIEREHGEVKPGLYAKLKFATKRDAAAVMLNPKLGVSARIRPNVKRAVDGARFKNAIIHVLGTLNPVVTGMTGWTPAVDLSEYAADYAVLDLSNATYSEVPVAKKNKNKGGSADDLPDISELTEEDIENFTDEQLVAFNAKYGHLLDDADDDDDSEDDQDDDDQDDNDDSEDDEMPRRRELQGASLSASAQGDIELATSMAAQANQRAVEALRRAADAEWREMRQSYLLDGVPPHLLDLAMPVLNRPDEMVIDLSHTDDPDVNVSKIVRGLLDAAKGTIDLSNVIGHGGSDGDTDAEEAILAQFENDYPL